MDDMDEFREKYRDEYNIILPIEAEGIVYLASKLINKRLDILETKLLEEIRNAKKD